MALSRRPTTGCKLIPDNVDFAASNDVTIKYLTTILEQQVAYNATHFLQAQQRQ